MVQTAGVPFREFRQRIELVSLQSGVGCTKGDLLQATATGWAPTTTTIADASAGKYAIALATVVAVTSTVLTVRAIVEGAAGVTKVTTTVVWYGEALGPSATAGAATVVAVADLAKYCAGWGMEAAISGDKSVGMMLRA
jgi:hypothetical protein